MSLSLQSFFSGFKWYYGYVTVLLLSWIVAVFLDLLECDEHYAIPTGQPNEMGIQALVESLRALFLKNAIRHFKVALTLRWVS